MPDVYRNLLPGDPVGADSPIFSAERNNALSRLADPARRGGMPTAGPDRAKGAGGAGVRQGVVKYATAAEWDEACGVLTPGDLEAWPAAEPPEFSAAADYQEGDAVTHEGARYCAGQAVAAGPFDGAGWDALP